MEIIFSEKVFIKKCPECLKIIMSQLSIFYASVSNYFNTFFFFSKNDRKKYAHATKTFDWLIKRIQRPKQGYRDSLSERVRKLPLGWFGNVPYQKFGLPYRTFIVVSIVPKMCMKVAQRTRTLESGKDQRRPHGVMPSMLLHT